MFEGMACAKPIILGIQGEAAELIEEAHAGLCVSPDDPSALSEAVRFLMSNSEKAREMGLNGRRYVSNRFSRDSRTHELIDILERLPAVRRQQALDAIPRRAQLVGK
jgi:glycosyltransferase involved in cell wall biosynthesis